ncbi:MAG: hypothetical protein Q9169_004262 [Polycauliona sp. 2 TL-2023]
MDTSRMAGDDTADAHTRMAILIDNVETTYYGRKIERLALIGARKHFDLQSLTIKAIFEGLELVAEVLDSVPDHKVPVMPLQEEPSYPPHEYKTSFITYTVRSPDQVYCHDDHQNNGPEYNRFQSHKSSLEDLSKLLAKQSPPGTDPIWQKELHHLRSKFSGWNKEMEWNDAAFTEGEEHEDEEHEDDEL